MESIEIKNFLCIKHAEIDIRDFTVLIGPQATGKSVIAKLVYFFREFADTQYVRSIGDSNSVTELQNQALLEFERLFPSPSWQGQNFTILYRHTGFWVSIARGTADTKSVNLTMSRNLKHMHSGVRRQLKAIQSADELREFGIVDLWSIVRREIEKSSIGASFGRSIFMPASRSFFATLQKHVFSFLANDIAIDPLIKEFGSIYETSKVAYNRKTLLIGKNSANLNMLRQAVRRMLEIVIAGEYVYEEGEDWIIADNRKTNLTSASSGQQEALPLFLVLFRSIRNHSTRPITFFIEEPEAHLFPTSQRDLIDIFSKIHHVQRHRFFLTTHSPYILTALNNLIMASNVTATIAAAEQEKVNDIVSADMQLSFESVRAYTIQDGIATSIIDHESNLIGTSIIDSVSDEFADVFDRLVELSLRS